MMIFIHQEKASSPGAHPQTYISKTVSLRVNARRQINHPGRHRRRVTHNLIHQYLVIGVFRPRPLPRSRPAWCSQRFSGRWDLSVHPASHRTICTQVVNGLYAVQIWKVMERGGGISSPRAQKNIRPSRVHMPVFSQIHRPLLWSSSD